MNGASDNSPSRPTIYLSESGSVGNGVDPNRIFAWIDNYCAPHPLDSIATASIALVSELSKPTRQ